METNEAYRAVRERMIALTTDADPATPVPACPEWTITELFAHVTGVAADVLAGRLEGAGTDPWVDAQVQARTHQALAEITAEWAETGPQVDDVCIALGDGMSQLIFDTATHEQDLRSAVGQPGGKDGAVDIAVRWATGAWAGDPNAAESVRMIVGAHDVTRGDGPPVATVALEPYEALRALSGRRSVDQLLAYDWEGDAGQAVPAFTWGPFTPRGGPLIEG